MDKTVKVGKLKLSRAVVPRGNFFCSAPGTVVPLRWDGSTAPDFFLYRSSYGSTALTCGSTARVGNFCRSKREAILGRKWMISRSKLERFHGWKVGKLGEMLDPLESKQIHGSNPTKLHHTNKSQKILGLFLVGIFELGRKTTKSS